MNNKNNKLPGILVTGASGFIGKHFVNAVSEKFRLFCIARRSQKEVDVPFRNTIHWLQADITKWKDLLNVCEYIKQHGNVDYVLHLAGYYDFTLKENPVYEQVNVIGTRYLLELSKMLEVKRFIFSSSVAACNFPPEGKALTEESPADGDFPYACSKRRAELLIQEYSESFPCSIVRLAAVYSDWCEFPMLYMLLKRWISKNKMMSRVVAGYGESAIPYIHIRDLIKLFVKIIDISDTLPQLGLYIAGPNGSVSHNELFKTATRYYYGRDVKSFRVPKLFARMGLYGLYFSGWLIGKEMFEKPWMAEYIDKKLAIDATATHTALGWKPTPRYHILRRLLFLTEKMASQPKDWIYRNEILLYRPAFRKSTRVYDLLIQLREPIIQKIIEEVTQPANARQYPNYLKMDGELMKWHITLNYQVIAATVRNRERSIIPAFAKEVARRRYAENFPVKEVKALMVLTGKTMVEFLIKREKSKDSKQQVDDYIVLTSQFAADEFEDAYEILESQPKDQDAFIKAMEPLTSFENIKLIVTQLEDVGSNLFSFHPKGEVVFKKYGALIKLNTSNK